MNNSLTKLLETAKNNAELTERIYETRNDSLALIEKA